MDSNGTPHTEGEIVAVRGVSNKTWKLFILFRSYKPYPENPDDCAKTYCKSDQQFYSLVRLNKTNIPTSIVIDVD